MRWLGTGLTWCKNDTICSCMNNTISGKAPLEESQAGCLRGWSVRAASVTGRDHVALRRGSQDAARVRVFEGGLVAVVCDGCGRARASEVGAALWASLVASALARGARAGERLDVAARAALDDAAGRLAALVGGVASTDAERAAFIGEHLLATVLGFVVREADAVLFAAGDGLVALDGRAAVLDADNAPAYPGYALLPRGASAAPGPASRHLALWPFDPRACSSVAVATDGFAPSLLDEALRAPRLERFVLGQAARGAFSDDASLAVAAREPALLSTRAAEVPS